MKTRFRFTLTGKDWWKPFLGYWGLYLGLVVSITAAQNAGSSPALSVIQMVGVMILVPIFTIVFLRIFLPKLSVDGKSFSFRGDIGRYLGMNTLGLLLSVITVGIYAPWYIRRITAYIMGETTVDGVNPEFRGKSGTLLKFFLLSLYAPVIVLSIFISLVFAAPIAAGHTGPEAADIQRGMTSSSIVMAVAIFFLLIPFLYLLYKWTVSIRWKDVDIAWETSFWPSCGFLLAQMLLTVLTLSIYWPVAALKSYRYFMERTALAKDGVKVGRLGFEGGMGQGFGLLWGQVLLSIVTLGIYAPWASANIGRWVLGATWYEAKTPNA